MQMYLEGVSTRKVCDVTEALCGTSFSKSTESNLVKTLDADLAAWRERPIGDVAYPFILVDATYQHVRVNGQVVSQAVLIMMGIREDGRREVIAVAVSGRESGPDYGDLFRSLRARGLRGVELVVSDDHAGLRSAITRHFPGIPW
jgi:transposase-like protein